MSISDKLLVLSNSKNDIKQAIINKGKDAGNDITTYAGLIDSIDQSAFDGIIVKITWKYLKDDGSGNDTAYVEVNDCGVITEYSHYYSAGETNYSICSLHYSFPEFTCKATKDVIFEGTEYHAGDVLKVWNVAYDTSIVVSRNNDKLKETVYANNTEFLFSYGLPNEALNVIRVRDTLNIKNLFYYSGITCDVDLNTVYESVSEETYTVLYLARSSNMTGIKMLKNAKYSSVSYVAMNCNNLKYIDFNGSDFSKCAYLNNMIYHCDLLEEVDLSKMIPPAQITSNAVSLISYVKNLKKLWFPKEWNVTPTSASISEFRNLGGYDALPTNFTLFTDAISEADQKSNGLWNDFTLSYDSSGTKIPDSMIRYGATHDEYETF